MIKYLTFLVGIISFTIIGCVPLSPSTLPASQLSVVDDDYKKELHLELKQHFRPTHAANILFTKTITEEGSSLVNMALTVALFPTDVIDSTFYFKIDDVILKDEFVSLKFHEFVDSEVSSGQDDYVTKVQTKMTVVAEFVLSKSLSEQLLNAHEVTCRAYINNRPENYVFAGSMQPARENYQKLVALQKFLKINDVSYSRNSKDAEINERARPYQKKVY